MNLPMPIGRITGNSFELDQDFFVSIPDVGSFHFGRGWQFEASLPWFAVPLLRLLPMSECLLVGSCIHDWFYCVKLKEYPRSKSDEIMRKIFEMYGTPCRKARYIYYAVRLAGGHAWNNITVQEKIDGEQLGTLLPK